MLKHTVTYINFDGVEESKDLYFNISRTEAIDLNLEYEKEGGLAGYLKRLMDEGRGPDGNILQKPAVDFIKFLIDMAYGIRPKDDPSAFVKEDDNGVPLIKKFRKTLAYDAFVFGIMSGDIPLEKFSENALPQMSPEQMAQARKAMIEQGYGDLIKLSDAAEKPAEG